MLRLNQVRRLRINLIREKRAGDVEICENVEVDE
jgi:hypothetical protein